MGLAARLDYFCFLCHSVCSRGAAARRRLVLRERWKLIIQQFPRHQNGGATMKKTEPDSKGPGEFIFFAMELLPDELWLVSIAVGLVFGLIWLISMVVRTFLAE
jgi:hypothetical protein